MTIMQCLLHHAKRQHDIASKRDMGTKCEGSHLVPIQVSLIQEVVGWSLQTDSKR